MSQNQWISVKYGYPDCEYGIFLTHCVHCDQSWMSIFHYQDGEFFQTRVKDNKQEEVICSNQFVTHWMPLPEPPTNL